MRRVLVTTVFSLLFGALFQALSLKVPLGLNLFFIPPVMLVFALQFFKPFEIMFVGLFCGAIADALGGFPIGFNMILMLVGAVLLGSFRVLSGRIQAREFVYYVIAISLMYRLLLLITQVVMQNSPNFQVIGLLFGPLVDGIISIFLYPLLVKVLSLLKVFDQNDFFRNRIGLSS